MDEKFSLEEYQEKLVLEKLKPGTILHLFCRFVRPTPKYKYLVLVSDISDPHLFIINSGLNNFQLSRTSIIDCQILLKASEYSFLQQNSHLNCYDVIKLDKSVIISHIKSNPNDERGTVSKETAKKIIEATQQNRTLTGKQKKLIKKSLKHLTQP